MQKPEARGEEGDVDRSASPHPAAHAPADLCDRCGAQAYVRVLLPGSGELLFCAHHSREHAEALAKMAVEIQDETSGCSDRRSWASTALTNIRRPAAA